MSENVFKTFPSNYTEALAILYLQNQDLSHKTPKQIFEMFISACGEINEARSEKFPSDWSC